MALPAWRAMVRKDLLLFFTDRRAVIMSFAAPIAIASFFGFIFSGNQRAEPARVPVRVVDQDGSVISKAIVRGLTADKTLEVTGGTVDESREAVRRGKTTVAVVVPAGFGEAAGQAFFGGGAKPQLELLYDPSHGAELAMVRGESARASTSTTVGSKVSPIQSFISAWFSCAGSARASRKAS